MKSDEKVPSQVIAGWTEALQLMVEGDHWEIYVPSELARWKTHNATHNVHNNWTCGLTDGLETLQLALTRRMVSVARGGRSREMPRWCLRCLASHFA